jgi:ketosteroid isomerase-like protein
MPSQMPSQQPAQAPSQALPPNPPKGVLVPAAPPDPNHPFTPLPALGLQQITPDILELITLEGTFSDSVAKGGGRAFASWFAPDGITLSNGKPPVTGHDNIAATATWDPKDYQLTWFAEGAQMGPSKDTGFTWGHYDAVIKSPDGTSSKASGRYITFWKKVKAADGKREWKVALDASAEEPPNAIVP